MGGIPAEFCSDSDAPALIPIVGKRLEFDITEACLAILVLSIACSRLIFSAKNFDKKLFSFSSWNSFHHISDILIAIGVSISQLSGILSTTPSGSIAALLAQELRASINRIAEE